MNIIWLKILDKASLLAQFQHRNPFFLNPGSRFNNWNSKFKVCNIFYARGYRLIGVESGENKINCVSMTAEDTVYI